MVKVLRNGGRLTQRVAVLGISYGIAYSAVAGFYVGLDYILRTIDKNDPVNIEKCLLAAAAATGLGALICETRLRRYIFGENQIDSARPAR